MCNLIMIRTPKYITYIDAKDLYVWAMSQYLPYHKFKCKVFISFM